MKYKTKLLIGFSSLLLLMVLLFGILSNVLGNLSGNINEIVEDRYIKLKLANTVQNNLNNMSRLVANIVLDDSKESRKQDEAKIMQLIAETTKALDLLQEKVRVEQAKHFLASTTSLFKSYTSNTDVVIEKVEARKIPEATALINHDMKQMKDDMLQAIKQLEELQESLLDQSYASSMELYHTTQTLSITFMILGLVIGSGLAYWVIKGIGKNLNEITSVISTVELGSPERLPRIFVASNDEIGDIAKAFNKMAASVEEHAKQEKEYKQVMQGHSWLKTQIAEITSLCQGVQDVETLAQKLVQKITPLVGASYGVLFTREGFTETHRLLKTGTYAYDERIRQVNTIEFGEGLVGQCALENTAMTLSPVPDNYIQIGSGLGSAKPTMLMILPISYEGQVLAVLELASLRMFTPLQQNFLTEIVEDIGPIFNSIFKHMQVRNLLKESQTLTEELQSQSEELQLQQEELRSINEKLEDQYKNAETKTKELEKVKEELEANAVQVQMASQYKSEFLANMSHELRTPLNSLLILAQILAENKDENLTEKQVEFASTILSSGNNLLNLINDILDLTKVESGKMEVHLTEVETQEISRFAESNFRPIALQKKLDFTIELAANLPEKIHTDEQRLQQIITNLLSNAFKFTSGGSVQLKMFVQDSYDGAKLVFSVADTGIGISKEKQKLIFEAFQQADGTTSRKYGGTGLGLSISRQLATLLGGFIQVESVEGIGSTFTLYLPVERNQLIVSADPYALAPVAASHPELKLNEECPDLQDSEGLKGKKVLVVDDDMRNIFALTAALEERQMSVFFAENGLEGIQSLEDHPDIDIVLMDIMMPEMDGYEAIRQIRSKPLHHKLPIIALTAKAMKHDREKCIEAGASDYISKPVNMEQLMSLLRVWLYS